MDLVNISDMKLTLVLDHFTINGREVWIEPWRSDTFGANEHMIVSVAVDELKNREEWDELNLGVFEQISTPFTVHMENSEVPAVTEEAILLQAKAAS